MIWWRPHAVECSAQRLGSRAVPYRAAFIYPIQYKHSSWREAGGLTILSYPLGENLPRRE